MQRYGTELLADLYGIEPSLLRDEERLVRIVRDGLIHAGFTVLAQSVHRFVSGGEGVTAAFLLSESHATIHTYPEWGYLAADIFSCGKPEPDVVLGTMVSALGPREKRALRVRRHFAASESRPPSPTAVVYQDRWFAGIVNYNEGDFTGDTLFHYRQEGDVVWGTYQGGGVRLGTLVARVEPDGHLDMRWQHVNVHGEFRHGTSSSEPLVLSDGRLRLADSWSMPTTDGGLVAGISEVEEIREPC